MQQALLEAHWGTNHAVNMFNAGDAANRTINDRDCMFFSSNLKLLSGCQDDVYGK